MTPEGSRIVTDALSEAGIHAQITPEPQPGEDLPYADLRTNQEDSLARVLNALHQAGLLHRRGPSEGIRRRPELEFVATENRTVPGDDHPRLRAAARLITFKDLNARWS